MMSSQGNFFTKVGFFFGLASHLEYDSMISCASITAFVWFHGMHNHPAFRKVSDV